MNKMQPVPQAHILSHFIYSLSLQKAISQPTESMLYWQ